MPDTATRPSDDLARLLEETQRLAKLGSWSWDIVSGRVEWSGETYRILGYDPESTTPSFERVLETAHDPESLGEFERVTEAALAGERPYDLILPLQGADGAIRYVHAFGEVERNEDGAPTRMFGFLHDITEAHQRELDLARSEERFRALSESSPFGVFFADAEGDAVYASTRLLDMYDLDFEAFCAGAWIDRIVEEDRDRVDRIGAVARDRREGTRLEYRIAVGDEIRNLRIATRPEFDAEGKYLGQVGVVEDITADLEARRDREELEAQLRHAQQLDSLGVLAGGIAHDFNNLLVGVLANAEMARLDLEEGHPAMRAVEDIERAADRAADLTRQLLAYAGKWAVVVEPVDLTALVEEMVQLMQTVVSRRASLQVDCALDVPRVAGDATQLRQIVMNLLKNAGDALDGEAGVIGVRVRSETGGPVRGEGRVFGEPLQPGRRYAVIEIEDTGVGMSEEVLGRIFDPFYSAKSAGRGLGLATSLRIVRSHRGSIRVRTSPGEGTTFTLFLPATEAASTPDYANDAPSVTIDGEGTILVVDDEAAVRDVAAAMLRRAGFEVLFAEDGKRAVEVYRDDPGAIRAILLDLTMPVMGGEEALRTLRSNDPEIPVVLMSGFADSDVGALMDEAGATAFIDKPFRSPELYAAVARVLEAARR